MVNAEKMDALDTATDPDGGGGPGPGLTAGGVEGHRRHHSRLLIWVLLAVAVVVAAILLHRLRVLEPDRSALIKQSSARAIETGALWVVGNLCILVCVTAFASRKCSRLDRRKDITIF